MKSLLHVWMRRIAAAALGATGLAAAEPAPADEVAELTRGPVPAWVERLEWPDSKAASTGHPAEILLSDAQGMLREDGCDYYFRMVVRLLNREGLKQNAEQSVTFSPEYQRVVWHTMRIVRDGETVDLLPKVRFRRLQRELGLEGQVYDGRITAVAVLEDVRVGDILETAYSLQDTNPLTRGLPSFRMSLGAGYPVRRQVVLTRLPARLPRPSWYFFVPPDTQGLPEAIFGPARMRGALRDQSNDEEHVYRWEAEDIPAISFDSDISGEAVPYYPTIRCSSFNWWSKVADWALPLFETGEELPAEAAALVARWRQHGDAAARLRAAVDWVQGDVRYFSMAFGQHNVKPRSMAEIVRTRFGDCKDKSVLLAKLLTALGIPAWPALVNTYSEHLVKLGGPDAYAFNHAIVAYEFGRELRWVDPTLRQPAGRAGEWGLPASYSAALVIRRDESNLTELPKQEKVAVDAETTDRIRLNGADGTAELDTEVRLLGLQADLYRMGLDAVSDEQRSKGWFNYLARFYPQLEELEAPKVTDNHANNVLTIRARYRVDNALRTEQGVRQAQFYAYALRALVESPESRRRHWPLALPFGRAIRQRIEVELPEDVPTSVRPTVVRTKEMEYRAEKTTMGRRFTAVHELRFNARHVPPERMKVFASSIEEMLNEMSGVVRFGAAGTPPAAIKTPAAQ